MPGILPTLSPHWGETLVGLLGLDRVPPLDVTAIGTLCSEFAAMERLVERIEKNAQFIRTLLLGRQKRGPGDV
ncbi:hypothetical protein QO004_005493 [Rhizobium mesoamericanum]|uniref:hypothetical protein n=1 Tax=Rhizobium mesoamericanum TaxID=1079800 RepID=UPI0027822217|nr:hypothetical protein [Rhizobium mesoamericanum]MDQ0563677.1 hypothetical protein [Rhizobium mesoamericanum]